MSGQLAASSGQEQKPGVLPAPAARCSLVYLAWKPSDDQLSPVELSTLEPYAIQSAGLISTCGCTAICSAEEASVGSGNCTIDIGCTVTVVVFCGAFGSSVVCTTSNVR